MKKTIAFIALIITCTALGILRSDGAQVSYSVVIPTANTGWTNPVSLHQFPPALGQLYKVQISAEFTNHHEVSLYSFASGYIDYSIDFTSTVKLLWPDGSTLATKDFAQWDAGSFDNIGATHNSSATELGFFNKESCRDFGPPSPPATSWLGNGTLAFKAAMVTEFLPGSTDLTQIFGTFVSTGGMSVTITYFYTPGLIGTAFPCH